MTNQLKMYGDFEPKAPNKSSSLGSQKASLCFASFSIRLFAALQIAGTLQRINRLGELRPGALVPKVSKSEFP